MIRRMAGLCTLLALLGACASRPAPLPPPAQASAAKARIIEVALAEWRAWGEFTVDGWPTTLPREPAPGNFQRILRYWSHVEEGQAVILRHQETHDALVQSLTENLGEQPAAAPAVEPSIFLWAWPAWSAAFISHVMAQAGVPRFVFPPSAAHSTYVDTLLTTAMAAPDTAGFLPQDPNAYAARPGDLLCADRAQNRLISWQDRLNELGQFRPMHCDVVIANGGGRVQAIGGNVLDAVVLRRFPTDAAGRVLPAPWDKPQFFLILQNRL